MLPGITRNPATLSIRTTICAIAVLAMTIVSLGQSNEWSRFMSVNDIAYFQKDSPPEIQRFDLSSKNWLEPISLGDVPRTFWVDSTHLYVGFDRKAVRLSLEGTNEELIANTATAVRNIFTLGEFVYITDSEYYDYHFFGYRKSSLGFVSKKNYWNQPGEHITVDEENLVVYFHSSGVSPSDVIRIQFDAEGHAGELLESPYHGDYPAGNRQFLFPGGQRIVEDSGIVYNSADLTYNGSLQGSFEDLAFYENAIPIVLRGNRLESYNEYLLFQGDFQLGKSGNNLAIFEDDILIFREDSQTENGIGLEVVDIDQIEIPEPGAPIDPNGLAFEIDSAFIDAGGILNLLSKSLFNLFRYSVEERRYLESIPLLSSPELIDYSTQTNRVYIAYPTGTINYIDLSQDSFEEVPFVGAPQKPHGLKAIENFLLVADSSGAWNTHYVYSGVDGSLIDQADWNRYSREYAWNPKFRRLFMFRDGTSPNDLEWEEITEEGMIGESGDSPFHSSAGIQLPIRVSQDNNYVLLGSGRFYDASTLDHVDNLSNNIIDALWIESELYTIRDTRDPNNYEGPEAILSTVVQRWSASYGVVEEITLPGNPIRMFERNGSIIVLSSLNGYPRIYEVETSLEMVFASELGGGEDDMLSIVLLNDTEMELSWNPQLVPGERVDIEIFNPVTSEWEIHDTVEVATGGFLLDNLQSGQLLDIRLANISKYQTQPLPGGYTQVNRLYYQWESIPDEVRLERRDNQTGNWANLETFPEGSYQSEYHFQEIIPFEVYELRLLSFSETLTDITEFLEDTQIDAHFNWMRDTAIEDGFVITHETQNPSTVTDFRIFSNDVFSFTIEDISEDFDPSEYKVYSIIDDTQPLSENVVPNSDFRSQTILQISIDRLLSWPAEFGQDKSIRIEGSNPDNGEWLTVEDLNPGVSSFPFRQQTFGFQDETLRIYKEIRVSEVEESAWNPLGGVASTSVFSELYWDEYIPSENSIIQQRESQGSEWTDIVGSSGYYSWSTSTNENFAREYRPMKVLFGEPETYGFATAVVPGETTSSLVITSNPKNAAGTVGGGTYTDGSTAWISAADSGLFSFDHWTGVGISDHTASRTSVVVAENTVVVAVYSLTSPPLTLTKANDGMLVRFEAMIGGIYQLQESSDGKSWSDVGQEILGTGEVHSIEFESPGNSILIRLQTRSD